MYVYTCAQDAVIHDSDTGESSVSLEQQWNSKVSQQLSFLQREQRGVLRQMASLNRSIEELQIKLVGDVQRETNQVYSPPIPSFPLYHHLSPLPSYILPPPFLSIFLSLPLSIPSPFLSSWLFTSSFFPFPPPYP